jgi:hypothetical protein
MTLLSGFVSRGVKCHALRLGDDEFEHFPADILRNVKLGAVSFFPEDFSAERLERILLNITTNDYEGDLARVRRPVLHARE